MPIYEYRCAECHQVFEEWSKHVEDTETPHSCPICRGRAERLISNTSFALKGTGWYVTEYGSRKENEKSTPADTAKVEAEPSVSAGADVTPAAPQPTCGTGCATQAAS